MKCFVLLALGMLVFIISSDAGLHGLEETAAAQQHLEKGFNNYFLTIKFHILLLIYFLSNSNIKKGICTINS